ncbi:MAG: hypothetical protein LBS41_00610 [Streptococcaceae bacterium]|nr:hypothetical protein [Streptococcaceae bacterium]
MTEIDKTAEFLASLKFYEWLTIKEITDKSFQDNLTTQKIENKEAFKKRLQALLF